MTDQELFNKLKWDGECWHETPCEFSLPLKCRHCGVELIGKSWNSRDNNNPDFDTWEGFGWLWERVFEKDWGEKFWIQIQWDDDFRGHIHPTRFKEALKKHLTVIEHD